MIFTCGYDGKNFAPAQLTKILDDIGNCTLVDVRLVPFSRIKGWGTKQLISTIGKDRYLSRKDLGGGAVTESAIDWLADTYNQLAAPHALLLCKEENPGACHRHFSICADNFPDAMHIFRDGMMSEAHLDGMLERNEEPEVIPLAELRDFVKHYEAA